MRTPTATVTDLGTEFGVEVDERGNTTSHVFGGSVRVQAVAGDNQPADAGIVLNKNQTARVERRAEECKVVLISDFSPSGFVCKFPKKALKILDLVDVAAGGDGYGERFDAGIDPVTGQTTTMRWHPDDDADPNDSFLKGDGKYHRVAELPLIDGVFIPNGGRGPVTINSAGQTFSDFPETADETTAYIWSFALSAGQSPDEHEVLKDIDRAMYRRAVLDLHANAGITFDLEAIRRANPGYRLLRFRAKAGNTEPVSRRENRADVPYKADIWVLVDGETRFRRREINGWTGVCPVVVSLSKKDRFLTLAATDGGNGVDWDWTMFGDPQLELITDAPVIDEGPEARSR